MHTILASCTRCRDILVCFPCPEVVRGRFRPLRESDRFDLCCRRCNRWLAGEVEGASHQPIHWALFELLHPLPTEPGISAHAPQG